MPGIHARTTTISFCIHNVLVFIFPGVLNEILNSTFFCQILNLMRRGEQEEGEKVSPPHFTRSPSIRKPAVSQ